MLKDCQLKDLFLVEQLPAGTLPMYDCESFGMTIGEGGSIRRANARRIQLRMIHETYVTDYLLGKLIYETSSTNKTIVPRELQLAYKIRDLPIGWMLKPNKDITLEEVLGDEYIISNVLEDELSKIKEVVCDSVPEGEVIFTPPSEYFSRLALGDRDDVGIGIFNPMSVLKCSYRS